MSREALSLEIAGVVSRVVRGETIDTAESGAAIAEKYPDIGMSGAQIGQAIERAAGMVGMMRDAPEPIKPALVEVAPGNGVLDTDGEPGAGKWLANGDEVNGHPAEPASAPRVALPVATPLFNDQLAAEVGTSASRQSTDPVLSESPSAIADKPAAALAAWTNGAPPAAAPVHVEGEMPSTTGTPLAPSTSLETLEVPAAIATQPSNSILSSLRRVIFRA